MKLSEAIRFDDLVNNPIARIPICLCLDVSLSMEGDPIDELNAGVELFYEAIKEDEIALYSAEIAVVTFGNQVKCEVDFANLEIQPEIPTFRANGSTPMGEAVNLALDMLEARKEDYKTTGVDYYQPWLVLMTDGEPNGNPEELARAITRTTKMIEDRKLTIFPIGIGANADMNILNKFSPKRSALRLQGLKFKEFFQWLSQSVSKTSQSTPGETIPLDVEGIRGWGEL